MFSKRHQVIILTGLLAITVIVWIFVFNRDGNKFLKVEFFDVGQGDAEFIETPHKQQVLIDGGPDMSILEKLGKAMPFYDRYIDLIILTHPEQDHLNGLIEVIKRYNVGAIITTGVIRDTEQYKEWVNVIKDKSIPIYIARAGGQVDFNNNIRLDILFPLDNLSGKQISESNNSSIVTKVVYDEFKVIFTGDIEKNVETQLVNLGINLDSDVIKIAHHGSKTSTSDVFLKAVNAVLAVIEVGKDNQYGHPHQEVLERIKNLEIFQTGNNGNIKILSDGINFEIKK